MTPEHRRLGIGSALLRRVEELLPRQINLQVHATNAGVVAFYEQLGYRVEERVSMGKPLMPDPATSARRLPGEFDRARSRSPYLIKLIGMPLFMMFMNACRSLVSRWVMVPMHHL